MITDITTNAGDTRNSERSIMIGWLSSDFGRVRLITIITSTISPNVMDIRSRKG